MLLIQHKLTKKTGFKSLMLMCFILTGLTLGPLMGSIAIFGPDEAANQRYPAYAQWRIVRLGEYVEHVDFFRFISGYPVHLFVCPFLSISWENCGIYKNADGYPCYLAHWPCLLPFCCR